jgi:hypothetical protein
MRSLKIYWNDLTDEAKKRLHLIDHENVDMSPIAVVDIEDLEENNDGDGLFRNLTLAEEVEFKVWAREYYEPNAHIDEVWHPVIRKECEKINKEFNNKSNERTKIN